MKNCKIIFEACKMSIYDQFSCYCWTTKAVQCTDPYSERVVGEYLKVGLAVSHLRKASVTHHQIDSP